MIITIPRVPPGPNGRKGLFRMHWSARRRIAQEWIYEIRSGMQMPALIERKAKVHIHQTRKQRMDKDKHICPLQLGTIERCVRLWSNPGETVFSPFAGIGSEGYVAIQNGRKFIGIELKPLYARTAARNLRRAEEEKHSQGELF